MKEFGGYMKSMNLVGTTALLAAFSAGASAPGDEGFHPYSGPKPLFVWIESDPWQSLLGSDTPRVVLYEMGQLIYAKKDRGKYDYYSCVLEGQKLTEFKQTIAAAAGLDSLKSYYTLAPQITDQPTAEYYMDLGVTKATEIYAFPVDEYLHTYTTMSGDKKPDVIPAQLYALDKYLQNIDSPICMSWKPQYIEVVTWPVEDQHASKVEAPVSWPTEWPQLSSDHAIGRGHDGMYSLYLDSRELPKLKRLLEPIQQGGAMMLEGKKWFVTYRPVIPGEPVWRAAFEKIDAQQD